MSKRNYNVRWHDCFGTRTFQDGTIWQGDKYSGEWKHDQMWGQGTYSYALGSKYIGQWKGNEYNGQGTYTSLNGLVEAGIWKNGQLQSATTVTKPQSVAKTPNQTRAASNLPDCPSDTDWRSWKLCFGTRIWGPETKWAGDRYVGEWLNMARHGQGTYTFSGGDQYIGDFKHDNYNGQGKYTHLGGKVEEGTWKDSKLNGKLS